VRGQAATLKTRALGWEGFTNAIGAGPRLVRNGTIDVTALQENFREDVRVGAGPRTAFGLDKYGRYIICVVDGRQPFRSVGLTLTEMAATMQKLGAVNALNLDGGGSTSMAVKNRVINSPSDGYERSVSNALLVSR
jgi:exopolysaccharide biosynthesis protein